MKRRTLGEGDARLSCSRLLLVESHQRCHGCLGLDAKNISALPKCLVCHSIMYE
jgi:hypothetical protein